MPTSEQGSPFRGLLLARLRNFFHHRTPWQRSLWSIGSITGLLEVVEYATVGKEANLPNDGLRYVATAMREQVRRDHGVGPESIRADIENRLAGIESLTGRAYPPLEQLTALRHLAARCQTGYLDRWAAELEGVEESELPGVELVARSVATHLLDAGFSADHLDAWVREVGSATPPGTAGDLLRGAASLLRVGPRKWDVIIPLGALPGRLLGSGTCWLSGKHTADWLLGEKVDIAGLRVAGSYRWEVEARDPWAAVETAAELSNRAGARVRVAYRSEGGINYLGWARVGGVAKQFPLSQTRRKVEVPRLLVGDALSTVGPYGRAHQLDDAIELAAAMHEPAPAAALTGGWASIEALLLRPGEPGGHIAADRMAAIVTASLPRAELQTLGFGIRQGGTNELASSLVGKSGYHVARTIEASLRGDEDLALARPSDRAAADRLRRLITAPAGLSGIQAYIAGSLRRLYNQRNLVMHGGSFQSCALRTALRTTPPLVGAGLDRIANGYYGEPSLGPFDLAARAEIELQLFSRPGGRWLVDLLE